jgi:predicted nucleic acid-binding protein
MSAWVFDASVAIKWFVPENYSAEARRWRLVPGDGHAPAFFELEFANILWKKVRRAEITRKDADDVLAQLPAIPLLRHSDGPLLLSSFDLADRTGRTVYDCMYLALAVQLGATLVTADDRFVNSLATTAWAASIRRVQDVP